METNIRGTIKDACGGKPFDINKVINRISRVSIEKANAQPTTSSLPLFDGITSLSYKGYIYGRNGRYTKSDGKTNYYFLCSCCKNRITIQEDAKKSKYKIYAYDYNNENPHNENCIKKKKSDEVIAALAQMKAFAQQLFQENSIIYKPQALLSVILQEYAKYNSLHPHDPLPIIKNQTILNWFYSSPEKSIKNDGNRSIPNHLRYINEEKWVFLDITSDTRIIILASPLMINTADSATRLGIDGTFQSAPTGFEQVLNGVGYIPLYKKSMPLFHVLMQSKNAPTYFEVLTEIFSRLSEFSCLKAINFDFEPGLLVALRKFFQRKEKYSGKRKYHLQGCLFHYSQAIRKKFIELYKGDADFKSYYQAFLDAPMLDDNDYEILIIYMQNDKNISIFMSYFENQWIKSVPRSIWKINNQSDLDDRYIYNPKLDERYTNDSVENYNGKADDNMKHPSLEEFLQKSYQIDKNIYETTLNAYKSKELIDQCAPHMTKEDAKNSIQANFPNMFLETLFTSDFLRQKQRLHNLLFEIEKIPDNTLLTGNLKIKHSKKSITKKKPRDHSKSRAGCASKGNLRKDKEAKSSKKLLEYTEEILETAPSYSIRKKYLTKVGDEELENSINISEICSDIPSVPVKKRGRPAKNPLNKINK